MAQLKPDTIDLDHQALLDILRMSSFLFKLSDRFFAKYDMTDSRFNVLMMLQEYGKEGLSQQELSERLVVDKSHVTGLVDRLEKLRYVTRKARSDDRRYNRIVLAVKGIEILKKVEAPYLQEVQRMMGHLSGNEKKNLRNYIAKLMIYVNDVFRKGSNWPALG